MSLFRFIGRIFLAPIFIYGGMDTLRHPTPRVQVAERAGAPNADTAVRVNAAVMVIAGGMLLLNILPKLAAVLLAGSLVPTSFAGHQFWKKQGKEQKQQITQFLKNTAAIGGLLLFTAQGSKKEECSPE